jgi:NAD(P)-dependent dehydrogenase (short-subunit alcohol dehydrogenase family)
MWMSRLILRGFGKLDSLTPLPTNDFGETRKPVGASERAQRGDLSTLRDRVVLVTGGAMGIGEAIVKAFVAQGAKVGFIDVADASAEKLQGELGAEAKLHYEHCDVTDIAALRRAIENVRKAFGPITILVNNAAHDERHKVADVTPEFFDDRIAVNLKHQFFAAQAVYPDMKAAQNGSIHPGTVAAERRHVAKSIRRDRTCAPAGRQLCKVYLPPSAGGRLHLDVARAGGGQCWYRFS